MQNDEQRRRQQLAKKLREMRAEGSKKRTKMVMSRNRNNTRPRYVVLCDRCKQNGCDRAATGKSVRPDILVDRYDCPDCRRAQQRKGELAGVSMSQEQKLKLRTYNTPEHEKRRIWKDVLKYNGISVVNSKQMQLRKP